FNLEIKFDSESFKIHVKNPRNQKEVHFFTHSVEVEGWDFKIRLSRPLEFAGARPLVPIDFGDRVLRPLLDGQKPSGFEDLGITKDSSSLVPKPRQRTVDILIDPGHGGNDFGATIKVENREIYEKDLVLDIAGHLAA